MGKKSASSRFSSSRGNKANKDRKSSSSNNIGDKTGDEAITPENGWIFEKDEAVKAVQSEKGDILLLEKAVALGAALDYRTKKLSEVVSSDTEAFTCDTTALLLACSNLAFFGISSQDQKRQMLQVQPELAGTLRGNLECAIQLVKLGADCNEMYKEKNMYMHSLNLGNKNAYQLAKISKQSELIRTMDNFKSDEDKIRLVHCRCGSRLPWKECHGAAACGSIQVPYYYYENNNDSENTSSLRWRHSPLANCRCGYNDVDEYKQHFECCWSECTQHNYQNDYNGEYLGLVSKVSSKLLDEAKSFDYSRISKDVYVINPWREKMINMYTASPLARCANPTCKDVEVHVKSFDRCSRCNSVAYCSRRCQKEHWRLSHGKKCGLNNSLA
ncbi:hypothetical protein FRACYDRAFT_249528 [Fragilariopsis cylindrus CCMP1102]|uniref:MYND-type domain-containing protein n=1 Tax=Fragilariopsis cylindrus CCMP1102 TaxID=635003 RepID=A0A1E7ES62_9STRA|nr:hypothetical protein FRACYDRAFT_249528 [Fragilariopsis cylindrus CCMP1102]|eukprot:OEU08634.1 hypothetical protein FRACYDRAFT_249528 [Fragilariopsis cylindrus CCMP1102]